MKVLVTGVNGQLGHDVVIELNKRGYEPIGVDRSEMDLTLVDQIESYINEINPEAIIHCAAYTAVDKAEDEAELCRVINATSTKKIAQCAKKLDIPMIYISTDYVFNGNKGIEDKNLANRNEYDEYIEEDIPGAINIYGQTKLEGEEYIKQLLEKYYIVRISWVFGENGNNFIDTMLRLSETRNELNVIDDQVGSPTYTKDLSRLLVDMIETDKYGIYHATNEGFCSWYDFAKEIFKISNKEMTVNPILTAQYPTKAQRPLNSKLSKKKLINNGFESLRSWKEALEDYIKNSNKYS